MKLRVIWFGKPFRPIGEQIESYRQRIQRRWPAEEKQLKPASGGREADPQRSLKIEADALQKALPPRSIMIALDEGGRSVDSEKFAQILQRYEQGGCSNLAFVIGSDLGIDKSVRTQADMVLSLSPMTLPHQFARLLLWEQLFRATHILSGGSYHRRSVS